MEAPPQQQHVAPGPDATSTLTLTTGRTENGRARSTAATAETDIVHRTTQCHGEFDHSVMRFLKALQESSFKWMSEIERKIPNCNHFFTASYSGQINSDP